MTPRSILLFFAAALALSFCLYWPALHGAPLWDDYDALFANPLIVSPFSGWRRIWLSHAAPDFWPLHYTWFWLAWGWWGAWTLPYHLVNIVLHAANTTLFAVLLRRFGNGFSYLSALLFCVHPVNAEAVAWIVQFKTVASTTLSLGAVLAFLQFLSAPGRRRAVFYGVALILFGASLLVKSAAFGVPLVLAAAGHWQGWGWRRTAVVTVPFIVLAAADGIIAANWYAANDALPSAAALDLGPLSLRLARAGWNLGRYLHQAYLPTTLLFIYPQIKLAADQAITYLPSVIAVVVSYSVWRRQHCWLWRAVVYYGLALAPILGIFGIYFMRYSDIADHWQYLGLIAPLYIAVRVGAQLPVSNLIKFTAVILLVTGAALITHEQAKKYQNEEILWRDTVNGNPAAWVAHNNLGKALLARQSLVEAESELAEALRLKPDFRDAHNNLGALYLEQSQIDAALKEFNTALSLDVNYAVAESNLGIALTRRGDLEQAVAHLQRAVELSPEDTGYQKNLAYTLTRLNRLDEAATAYRRAIALNPQADYLNDLGQVLRQQGRLDEALATLSQALVKAPKHGLAMANIGFIWLQRGDLSQALHWLQLATDATPNSASIHLALATVLLKLGNRDDARVQLKSATSIDVNAPGAAELAAQLR